MRIRIRIQRFAEVYSESDQLKNFPELTVYGSITLADTGNQDMLSLLARKVKIQDGKPKETN
jgi:hypothetical protein